MLIESAEKLGSFAQYPEDLPFGQTVRDKFLYLGSPGAFGGRRSLPSLGALHRRANLRRWENRLEAARLLARHKGNPRAIAMLEQLSKDTVFLVAHVAGSVSSECAI